MLISHLLFLISVLNLQYINALRQGLQAPRNRGKQNVKLSRNNKVVLWIRYTIVFVYIPQLLTPENQTKVDL